MRKRRGVTRYQDQEKRIAATFGARQHPGSGNGSKYKADASTPGTFDDWAFLFEVKGRNRPDAKSITIKLEDLRTLDHHAAIAGKIPVLPFELGGDDYCIIPAADLAALQARVARGPGAEAMG